MTHKRRHYPQIGDRYAPQLRPEALERLLGMAPLTHAPEGNLSTLSAGAIEARQNLERLSAQYQATQTQKGQP